MNPRPGRPPKAPQHCRYLKWTKKHGHRYQACPSINGQRVFGQATTRDLAALEARDMIRRAQIAAGVTLITLREACQNVLDTIETDGTWRSYEEHFQTLLDFFGDDTLLHTIGRAEIADFVAHRRKCKHRGKPIGLLRINKHLTALKRVFNVATKRDEFDGANPVTKIEAFKIKKREAGYYDEKELAEVLETIREADGTRTNEIGWRVVAGLLFSGLRRTEFCRLTAGQIDLRGYWLRNIDGKTNVCNLPITEPFVVAVKPLLKGRKADGHLVPSGSVRGPRKEGNAERTDLERRIERVNGIFRRFRPKLRVELQDRFKPHTMRHSVRTLLAEAKVDVVTRNALTRHVTPGVGPSYDHVSPMLMRKEAQRVLEPLLYMVDPSVPKPAAEGEAAEA